MPAPHSLTTEVKRVSIEDGVALVTLTRPHVMNAVNLQLRAEIIDFARELDADPSVAVVGSPARATGPSARAQT